MYSKQLRPTDDMYVTGDKLYYKRAVCPEWKGPGVVIHWSGWTNGLGLDFNVHLGLIERE